MRRFPIYLLIDTSGSMNGAPIAAVNKGLALLVDALKLNPDMMEKAFLSILSFDKDVKEVLPLTELGLLEKVPVLVTPKSGPTHMGKALEVLLEKIDKEIIKNDKGVSGDYKPLLFVITDGKPSDTELYEKMSRKIAKGNFAFIVACAAGPQAKIEPLKRLTEENNICILSDMREESFAHFFQCVSQSIPVKKWDWAPLPHAPKDAVPGPLVLLRPDCEGE